MLRLISIPLILFSGTVYAQQPADLLITNGRILDGTGNSWYRGGVAIRGGKIVAVGNTSGYTATKTIDAKANIIAPGFIDVHTHIEGEEAEQPTADNFILDGVTTVITGNCGASHTQVGRYLRWIDSIKLSVNVAILLGQNDVRKAVIGTANRPATEAEIQQMERMVDSAMQQGAVGLSTGLIYIPGAFTPTTEIIRLAKVAARYNGVYATHMRDEGDKVAQAIDEALLIGREAAIPVQISHFKVSGQQNWGRSAQTLQQVMDARRQGLDVTIDQYPYTASSTGINTLLPDAVLADGTDSIRSRLQRPEVRKAVTDYILANLKKRKLKHISYAVVAYHKADTTYNGKSIEAINLLKGRKHKAAEEAQTVMDIVAAGGASAVFHGMSEEDVQRIMRYPFNMVASDASIRVMGKYVREEKVLTLEEAVRRMTSLPAQKFNLKNKGLLREGADADVVVFDEATVTDHSTFEKPHQYSTGFNYVVVNGEVVVSDGKHTGVRSGRAVRR